MMEPAGRILTTVHLASFKGEASLVARGLLSKGLFPA
jgi:hypothetical protein